MLNLIYGAKGTGKTKKIIDKANSTISDGLTAFITDTDRYMFDIKRGIRFINGAEYGVTSEDGLVGLVMGPHDFRRSGCRQRPCPDRCSLRR